jgi:hypothetical protein
MTSNPSAADRERIEAAARAARAPQWLKDALRRIGEEAHAIAPLPDDRSQLPEFIYRH